MGACHWVRRAIISAIISSPDQKADLAFSLIVLADWPQTRASRRASSSTSRSCSACVLEGNSQALSVPCFFLYFGSLMLLHDLLALEASR